MKKIGLIVLITITGLMASCEFFQGEEYFVQGAYATYEKDETKEIGSGADVVDVEVKVQIELTLNVLYAREFDTDGNLTFSKMLRIQDRNLSMTKEAFEDGNNVQKYGYKLNITPTDGSTQYYYAEYDDIDLYCVYLHPANASYVVEDGEVPYARVK